jgi:hypothetical protein
MHLQMLCTQLQQPANKFEIDARLQAVALPEANVGRVHSLFKDIANHNLGRHRLAASVYYN